MMLQAAEHSDGTHGNDVSELRMVSARLNRWLMEDAYPRWWSQGADHRRGGFHERLQQDGEPSAEARRARLHPRQIFSFSLADDVGHDGLTDLGTRHALDYFLRHYVRSDQLIYGSVAPDGSVVDDSVVLYDQAFALLGYAAAFDVFDDETLRERARNLLTRLQTVFANPAGGFRESPDADLPLASNSHMHLLEAALAWMALDHDPRWSLLAERIVQLATTRFRDAQTGQIREFFTADWQPAAAESGQIVEPGHQFEWAWLLLRWQATADDVDVTSLALSLIDVAEQRGLDSQRGVAVNSVWLNGRVRDARARLWPQAERLKAGCIAWETTRQPRYAQVACQAAIALERYLQTAVPGLWYDTMNVSGGWVAEPAPASTFYHLVAAITELSGTVNRVVAPT